jgi:sterol desaturase/sphingolipid hydroxylase (fatty acid hydroxylase superfamily)
MERLADLWQKVWPALVEPARYFYDHNERVYFGYLASSFVLGVGVYFYLKRKQPGAMPESVIHYLFPKQIYLHKSAIADYQFFVVDRILYVILFPVLALLISPFADWITATMTDKFGPPAHPLQAGRGWMLVAVTLLQVAWIDFMLYYIHYLVHKVPALWEFHKVHHSAEVMTPITAYRMHPVEVVFNMNVTALFTGLLLGVFAWLTAGGHPGFTIFGINAIQFAFYVVGFNLRHSHVPLGYGSVISQVLVSPWMHQVHHSRETRHLDMNMGFIFSFWDRMFGTLYVPKRDEADYALGLTTGEHVHFHGVLAMYFRPFANLARRWLKPVKAA